MSEMTKVGGSGEYTIFSDLMQLYHKKRKETAKGVSLKLERNKYLLLQFKDPQTGKRTSKSCDCPFTELGVLQAVEKANLVADKLKSVTNSSEFWEWYSITIENKNEAVADIKTYREVFKEISSRTKVNHTVLTFVTEAVVSRERVGLYHLTPMTYFKK
jgi:hypothetical protein